MKRFGVLVLLVAACGRDEPVAVSTPQHEAATEAARRAAHAAREALGAPASQALREADEHYAAYRETEARAAYGVAREAYEKERAAREASRKQNEEQAFQEAVDAQAAVIALRKRVDDQRHRLERRTDTSQGSQKKLYQAIAKACDEKIWGEKQLIDLDTRIERAKALLANKRHEAAKSAFADLKAELEGLPAKVERLSIERAVVFLQERVARARGTLLKAMQKERLAAPAALERADQARRRGDAKAARGEHKDAGREYQHALQMYFDIKKSFPVLRAERDEARRTLQAAVEARRAWLARAKLVGVDVARAGARADGMLREAGELLRAGRYRDASDRLRAARRAFEKLEPTDSGR